MRISDWSSDVCSSDLNLTAAKAFGLEVLERRIESNKKNYTRFLIISREHTEISNTNKASVCFRVNNNPGSLAKVLTIFAQQDINLSKIQSMPVLGDRKSTRLNSSH